MSEYTPHTSATTGPDTLVEQLINGLQHAAREITPQFVRTMPRAYFDDTTQAMRLAHLKAILAAEASGLAQTVTVRDTEGHHFTFISNQSYPGQLGKFVQRLPRDLPLTSAQVYTSEHGDRVIDIFHFGEHAAHDEQDPAQLARASTVREYVERQPGKTASSALEHHLRSCDAAYLVKTPLDQIYRHLLMADQIRRNGNVLVKLERYHEIPLNRLTIGFADYDPRLLFERVSHYLGCQDVDIQRAHLDSFQTPGDDVRLLTFIMNRRKEIIDPASELWSRIDFALRRLPHLDPTVFELSTEVTNGELLAAELLDSLTHLAHQKLVTRDPLMFSRERILAALQRNPKLALAVNHRFQRRFSVATEISDDASADLVSTITRETDAQETRTIFTTLVDAVDATLRTNLWLPNRQALALRIDPAYLAAEGRDEAPYGVFFVSGHQFDAFHVRFRDIARGGVRIVRPRGSEQFALEAERLYEEAYGLAFAQQQKNKDIPEGGAKGVILAAPQASLNQVGRAYADSLLDLIIPDPQLHALHNDYYRRDELLYLGPDENISDQLITWIVERARRRGHSMPDAFMSSKPGAGINHKQYGVTSEGVTIFLEHALRAVGIDPRQQVFTVKMTGGPDGDVAGNEILILHREYGNHARIIAIGDGSGCAEDPAGLAIDELTRLVKDASPVASFDPARLGPDGRVVSIDQPGGINLRNTLHNRITADAFIPAGGRPNTINESNWEEFLDANGNPSSHVIVEGANLFITPQARTRLSQKGVIIIKDSSANKAGVICSSFEIIASMLLEEHEFLALKPRYVAEVLVKLCALADMEASTLFREHRRKPTVHLPLLSERLSRAINHATDAINAAVAPLYEAHPTLVKQLVIQHLPASLYEQCGEKVFEQIPIAYLNRVIASSLASRIVYREGLDWIESMPTDAVAGTAERYLVEEAKVRALAHEVRDSNLPNRDRIADLLESGGVAAAFNLQTG